jgi:type IV pilus modification protein PilV
MEKRARNLGKEKGFTLIEVLFAIAILAFGLLAVASMQSGAIQGSLFASDKTQEITWAQNMLERLLALPYTDADLNAGNYEDLNAPDRYRFFWKVQNAGNFKTVTVEVMRYKDKDKTVEKYSKPISLTCIKPRV